MFQSDISGRGLEVSTWPNSYSQRVRWNLFKNVFQIVLTADVTSNQKKKVPIQESKKAASQDNETD